MDGCAVNRHFFKLHQPEFTHKVVNPFTSENIPFLFFSDPPHLIKTARNCLTSKKRNLWVRNSANSKTLVKIFFKI